MYNIWLIGGAALSAIAALLHVLIVWGGAPWYRFFGAGEDMASAAAAGQLYPAVVTLCIALVLSAWAAYALAGAGVLTALPRQKAALVAITAIYLMRGLAILPLLVFASQQATPFLVWSSLICLGYGIVHLIGVAQVWTRL
ncbi:MAG: hypothetical protein JSR83_04590 [Proteobacteria bacterium]|nr:hypothetical protein [Pseudomonadota bacterium]